jgi:hypothetical protein
LKKANREECIAQACPALFNLLRRLKSEGGRLTKPKRRFFVRFASKKRRFFVRFASKKRRFFDNLTGFETPFFLTNVFNSE